MRLCQSRIAASVTPDRLPRLHLLLLPALLVCCGGEPSQQSSDLAADAGPRTDAGGAPNLPDGGTPSADGQTTTPDGQTPATCVTSEAMGECGPYDSYSPVTGVPRTTIGNNVWAPIAGWKQTLYANDPGDWWIVSNMPAGNTAIVSYPSIGLWMSSATPLSSFSAIYSSFDETMNETPDTSAWAMYDLWLDAPDGTGYEVMIQHDFAKNGDCPAVATATFGGTDGVPALNWHLCTFGNVMAWKAGTSEADRESVQSGSVDLLAMLSWLVDNGYMAQGTGLGLAGYGWEIASTGGVDETFQVSDFTFTAALK